MTITEEAKKAAILAAIYKQCIKYGCSGMQATHGQIKGFTYYNNNENCSSHRAIEIGVGEALRLQQESMFQNDDLSHLARLAH